MKKWIGTIIGISVSLSLLFVSQVSVGSEGVVDSSARLEQKLPDTKTKIKVVTPKKVAVKPKVVAKTTAKGLPKNQITLAGKTISLVNSQGATAAPKGNAAGYWYGNGKVDDAKTTHIIGHNPGAFAGLFKLKKGSVIKITDSNGKVRNYKVYSILTVNDAAYGKNGKDYWSTIFNQKGEAISLQTCINNDWNLIVLAK